MQLYSTILAFSSWTASAVAVSHLWEKTEVWAPLPPLAQPDPIGPSGYAVEAFGHGAYMVTEGQYEALIVISNEGVILVDAPPTLSTFIEQAIGNLTSLPVTHIVYSHHHSDHIGAASSFTKPDVIIVAHEMTKRNLEALPHPTRPLPNVTFSDNYCLRVGNQTLELSYKGPNHVPGNIFIYAPVQKVLMLVDMIVPGWVPWAELTMATDVPGYIAAHDQALAYDFDHYIGGHPGRSGNRADVERQKEYVHDLFHNCQEALSLIQTNNPVLGSKALFSQTMKLNPGNSFAVSKVALDIPAEYCANVTNEKWLGILGGADTYGFENAYAMIFRGLKCRRSSGTETVSREGHRVRLTCIDYGAECTMTRPVRKRGRKPTVPTGKINDQKQAENEGSDFRSPQCVRRLRDIYRDTMYQCYFPFLSENDLERRWAGSIPSTNEAAYMLLMALCALSAQSLTLKAVFDSALLGDIASHDANIYFDEAVSHIPARIPDTPDLDYLRSFGLLAVYSLRSGNKSDLHRYLGLCHAWIAQHGFNMENNWNSSISLLEVDDRRRLFWCVYRLEIHSACVLGHIIRLPEAQVSVLYPRITPAMS
ncbi:maltose fermentation regulatory MAL33, partial [Fusarium mundagurra]